jgi:hypothetical protein
MGTNPFPDAGLTAPRRGFSLILKTLIQATEFTENTEKEVVIFLFCWLTQKVNHNFVITFVSPL